MYFHFMIVDGIYFENDIIQKLINNRFVTITRGALRIELILENQIDKNTQLLYTYVLCNNTINDLTKCIEILNYISKDIYSYLYLDLGYNGIKNKNNPDLFKGLINKIKPDYLLSNILNFNINDTYDGTNGIIVQDKYVHPNQLKFTSPSLLLHYFKKYLNQYIYNTETKSNHSQIITFNDKYIIDGKFNYFKQYLENPNKVILITNIFYTPDDNHICEQINFDYNICNNDKILLNSLLLSLNDSSLNDNNNIFYNNVWEKYINKDELFKNKIKNNFKKLCNLYK